MFLTLSLIVLLLGPLLYRWIEPQPRLMDALDGFIFVAIGGLVLFHMLPDIFNAGGWWSLLFLAFGMAMPTLMEKVFHRVAKQAHAGAMLLAAIGLGLHGMTDGAALAEIGEHPNHMLSLGVILHRIPVGLTIWWLLRPHFGAGFAWLVLLGIAGSTLLGHSLAESWLSLLSGPAVAWFEALVVGTILHVVFHRPYHENRHADDGEDVEGDSPDWLQGVGSLLGVVMLLAVLMPHWLGGAVHGHQHTLVSHGQSSEQVLHTLFDLSMQAAPWLLFAYVVAAIINFWFPRPFANVYGPAPAQALRGALTGLPLPICVPNASKLYRMLIKQGAGSTYAIAFLMASPLLGIDAVLLSWGLLGAEWALWRIGVTLFFALLMALLLGRWLSPDTPAERVALNTEESSPFSIRLQQAIRHGYAHLIDHTAPWVICGLVVAALLTVFTQLQQLPLLPVFLFLLCLTLPLHLCATGMTPVLAILIHNGLAPPLALVILLAGPAMNLSLLKLIGKLHGNRAKLGLAVTFVLLVALFGLLMPSWPPTNPVLTHSHQYDWWRYASLVILLLLYAGSLLRQGGRAFVAELLPTGLLPHKQHHHHSH